MEKSKSTVRILCEVGIMAALGFVFDELQGILSKGLFINGGSIGFAMVVVLVVAYRRGLFPAVLTGLLMGIFDIATSAYILHPAQMLLDYILPYALVGIAGLFRPLYLKANKRGIKISLLITGTVVGGLLKLLSHYLAGVVFWADPANFAWNLNGMNPYLYCFIYNIAFMGPSILLSGGLLIAIYLTAPMILNDKPIIVEKKQKDIRLMPIILSSILMVVGATIFTIFLIRYIKSFSGYNDGSAYEYDFDPDSLVIFVLGLYVLLLGTGGLVATLLKKYTFLRTSANLVSIALISFVYSIARLRKMYLKNKNPTIYWIWFAVGLVTLISVAIFFVVSLRKYNKAKEEKTINLNPEAEKITK